MKKYVIPLVLLLILGAVIAEENNQEQHVKVTFFFTEDCSHCETVKGYFEDFKKEYGEILEIEMVDVFTEKGYREFKNNGFIRTPGLVFNDQIKMEGGITAEDLREVIEHFAHPKGVLVRFFHDADNKGEEYERIYRILSTIDTEEVATLPLDYELNRNSYLYFGFSETPAVAVNELSFEENITEDLIKSAVTFYHEKNPVKIVGFYTEEEEKKTVNEVITSEKYDNTVSILWIDISQHSKEFYLNGFSETPSVVVNDTTRIENVTRKRLIQEIETLDSTFYTPITMYFALYPFLKYLVLLCIVAAVGVVVWKR